MAPLLLYLHRNSPRLRRYQSVKQEWACHRRRGGGCHIVMCFLLRTSRAATTFHRHVCWGGGGSITDRYDSLGNRQNQTVFYLIKVLVEHLVVSWSTNNNCCNRSYITTIKFYNKLVFHYNIYSYITLKNKLYSLNLKWCIDVFQQMVACDPVKCLSLEVDAATARTHSSQAICTFTV